MAKMFQKTPAMRASEAELLDQLGINREHLIDNAAYDYDGTFLKVRTEYVWSIDEMTEEQRDALASLIASSRRRD